MIYTMIPPRNVHYKKLFVFTILMINGRENRTKGKVLKTESKNTQIDRWCMEKEG